MKVHVFSILSAVSLLICLATALFWAERLGPSWLGFHPAGIVMKRDNNRLTPFGIVGHPYRPTPPYPGIKLVAWGDGYVLVTRHPSAPVQGPQYLTPESMQWEQAFRQHDRVVDCLGFHYSYWSEISGGGLLADGRQMDYTVFRGYVTTIVVPYWFVLVVTALLPLAWCRGAWQRSRKNKRSRTGRCAECGYDLRAHRPGQKCPECGTEVPAGAGGTDRIAHP